MLRSSWSTLLTLLVDVPAPWCGPLHSASGTHAEKRLCAKPLLLDNGSATIYGAPPPLQWSSSGMRRPNRLMIVTLVSAGECHLGTGRHHKPGLGGSSSRQEVAAINHRRGPGGVVYLRAGEWSPCRSGMRLEQISRSVTHDCEGVVSLNQRQASANSRSSSTVWTPNCPDPSGCGAAPARSCPARVRPGRRHDGTG